MTADSSNLDKSSSRFCRKCGYDLRESTERCPECGGPFDATQPQTYRTKPPSMILRWTRRILIPVAIIALAYGTFVGWLWWGWRAEQEALRALGRSTIMFTARGYPAVDKMLPRRLQFLNDRADALSRGGMGGLLTIKGDAQANELGHFKFLRDISIEQISDAGMANLRNLTRLRFLSIENSPGVTGSGLSNLAGMAQLERLRIRDTAIDDNGFLHLNRLSRLKEFQLSKSHVTGAKFGLLSGLSQLEFLEVGNSPLTDLGMQQIGQLQSLKSLTLAEMQMSDAGISQISSLSQLQSILLYDVSTSGSGFSAFQKLKKLRQIGIHKVPLMDDAVEPLIRIFAEAQSDKTHRMSLSLFETSVTPEGLQRFQTACPNVMVLSNIGR